jgi:hypothetical protein
VRDFEPYLRANLDVVGMWLDSGVPAEVAGAEPAQSRHGAANVTWIIRWQEEAREALAKHPDLGGYLQMSSRFMEGI